MCPGLRNKKARLPHKLETVVDWDGAVRAQGEETGSAEPTGAAVAVARKCEVYG